MHSNDFATQQPLATNRTDEDGLGAITRKRGPGGPLLRKIRTLDPARLTPDDYLDLTRISSISVNVLLHPANPASLRPARDLRAYLWDAALSEARGFLYYHRPPHSPPIAGELRFRLTPDGSSRPSSFAAGSDLCTVWRGRPWRLPLYKMTYRDCFRGVFALLLQDRLVSQRTLDVAASAARKMRSSNKAARAVGERTDTPTLTAFGQEFEMCLGANSGVVCVFVGPDRIFKKEMEHVFSFARRIEGKTRYFSPFEGPVVCCFERSRLPEHKGKRVVVLRVRRFPQGPHFDPMTMSFMPILQPVSIPDEDKYPIEELRPRVGELLKTVYHGTARPWAVDVDKPPRHESDTAMGVVLRTLFENEKLYGSFQLKNRSRLARGIRNFSG
ncbi:hypothetical protein LXA43DRAFT_1129764 [Ganoderma leucocontextum]|nr:hypothetical protein LXA43DRAFT_1129764 [Ganoderma leucocontextum]